MKIMWVLLASTVFSGIFETSPANAAEPSKMIVPYTPLTGASTPFWIAIEARLFQKYGLDVTPVFVAGSSTIVAAMTSASSK